MGKFYKVRTSSEENNDASSAKYSQVWHGFWSFASTHGFPFVLSSAGCFKRTAWLIVSLACFGLLIFNIWELVVAYLKYPVVLQKQWLHSTELQFPAVTVCNTNPIKQSMIGLSPRLSALVERWSSRETKRRRKRAALVRKKRSAADPTCTTELNSVTGTCYWIEDGSYAATEASDACRNRGGYTAHIKTEDTKNFLRNAGMIGSSAVWISLHDNDGTWEWGDGEAASWTDWDTGQPEESSSSWLQLDCVRVDTNELWSNTMCWSFSYRYDALCEKAPETLTTQIDTTTDVDTTQPDTTTVSETTQPDTTTLADTTQPDTTTLVETTQPDTTTLVKTTQPDTTTLVETTQPDTTTLVETTQPDTTTLAETTQPDTTTLADTTQPDTTTLVETTQPDTTTLVETTQPDSTTLSETTQPDTTTLAETTQPDTTTLAETTQPDTTTLADTTQPDTTTLADTTQPDVTTEAVTQAVSQYQNREPLREDFLQETEFLEALADESEEVKVAMGYQQHEFILDCTIAGSACLYNDFSTFFNAAHGNCYTFNAGWNVNASGDFYRSSRSGISQGLELLLNINQAEYLASNTQGAGVVTVIHPPNRMPFPEDEGLLAPPNHMTSIEITKKTVTRLPLPYGTCIDGENPRPELNVFEEELPVQYSSQACQKTCYQSHVIESCGCADPQYPMSGKAFSGFEGVACDIRNITQDDCMYGIELRYIRDELECECFEPCSATYFRGVSSKVLWPSEVEYSTIEHFLGDDHGINVTSSGEYVGTNLVKLQVYFKELNFEVNNEIPKYTSFKLASSFGSSMGLYLGISVLSLAEFLELFSDVVIMLFWKLLSACKKRGNNSSANVVQSEISIEERKSSSSVEWDAPQTDTEDTKKGVRKRRFSKDGGHPDDDLMDLCDNVFVSRRPYNAQSFKNKYSRLSSTSSNSSVESSVSKETVLTPVLTTEPLVHTNSVSKSSKARREFTEKRGAYVNFLFHGNR